MLRLRLRDIGRAMPVGDEPAIAPDTVQDERGHWHDSTMDLARGLEVVEASVDILLPDAPAERGR